ncbi:MAG: DNA-binding response regulator [Chloroflexi bacterium 54-19]|nr:MAG: DNA-binding response regulator [Chloroflexi bacterium 54-19]
MTKMIRRGLTYEGYRVEVASSGKEGLDLAREQAPDLVILDIMMPGLNGLEVLKLLRAADARLPILFLTAKDAPADQVRGLELGADDYVTKPFTFKVLLARIHALLRRQQIEAPALLRFSDLAIDVKSHAIFRGKREIVLSSLEFKILLEFMEHPRQVLSKETLLEQVWGYDFGGNSNVVEVYIGQLRQKLEEGGEPRLLRTVRGFGYVLRED